MVTVDDVDPAVQSILSAATERDPPDRTLSVDARSIPEALNSAVRADRRPVIAELKPTSPTANGTRNEDPVSLARAMVDGGAAALSVLTEPEHFGGSPELLRDVRSAVDIPVLRKDFILTEDQLDTVAADSVLLIARFLDDLNEMIAAAKSRGFVPLVEVHTADEARRALDAGASFIGINNRDLGQLNVDLATFPTVYESVGFPPDTTVIAESGLSTAADIDRMRAAGADGVLIGSAIMEHGHERSTQEIATNTQQLVAESTNH